MGAPAHRLRSEAGFTLVETMAVLVLGMLVMFAVLTTFENFASNTSRQTRVTDANNQVRNLMDRVVSDLRQAASIEVADAGDLVYTVSDSATQTRRERICLDSSGYVWRASLKYAPAPAPTPGAATALAAPGATCPTVASNAVPVTNLRSRNSVSNPIFHYDTAMAAKVSNVGMTFALDAGNAGHTDTSTLRASAFRRSSPPITLAVDGDDITIVCGSSGPLLTLSSSFGTASVTYATVGGDALGTTSAGSSLLLPATATTVVATVTSTSGAVTQLLKTLAC